MTKFYAIFSNRKSMRGVCSVFLIMLLVPLSGCSGFEDNDSRVELASGTVDNHDFPGQGTLLVYQLIRDYEEYGWEIDLVSGKGTWNVFWHDREATMASNHLGAAFWDDSN